MSKLLLAKNQMDDQTPKKCWEAILKTIPFKPGEKVLEPAKGEGNLYNQLPAKVDKSWCEYKDGKDFFAYKGKVDTVITNPPYKERGENLVIPFIEKAMEVADERVIMLLNHNCFLSLTPKRLAKWEDQGWGFTSLGIYNIKKWFGRYYLPTWEKGKPSIIHYETTSYED